MKKDPGSSTFLLRRFLRWHVRGALLLALLSSLLLPTGVHAQRGVDRNEVRGHTLFGDLRVEERKGGGSPPLSFVLILYRSDGNVFERQTVSNKGRYRFLSVPNGEYDIAVESHNQEVARVRLLLNESRFTDIRRDLVFDLQTEGGSGMPAKRATISAAHLYDRAPDNATRFEKALQEGTRKNYKQAISLLLRLVEADPKDFEAWSELGTIYFMQGDHREAEKAYLRSLSERPDYPLALINLAKVQMTQKQMEAAIQTLSRVVNLDPQQAEAHYLLGEAYLQVKKGSKAVVHLNEAIRLDPVGRADAHLRLATLYNAAQMKDKAAGEYEQYLAKNPDYPEKKKLRQYIQENKKPL